MLYIINHTNKPVDIEAVDYEQYMQLRKNPGISFLNEDELEELLENREVFTSKSHQNGN